MKKPRSWAEALQHPGIAWIEDERRVTSRDPVSGEWDSPPFFVYLNDGWNWDGLTAFAIYDFRELQEEWGQIEGEHCTQPGDE